MEPQALWVDTDLALGAPRGDVDDGWALLAALLAHRAGRVKLLGVSAVHGNTSATTALACAKKLLGALGLDREVPLYPGASGPGLHSPAAAALAAAPEGTRVLALGPLTNVARALALDPRLAGRVRVSMVGGNLRSWGRWAPWWPFEFNLALDAPAAREVFQAPVERWLYPLDVTAGLRVGVPALLRVARTGALGRRLVAGSLRWLAYAPLRYRSLSFPVWDLVPALDALGCLPREVLVRRLAVRGRGLLVDDPEAGPTFTVSVFDPEAGLRAFLALLAAA
ncbi:MAG: nucleoside hydrolase [Deltaproteobacteria bacterium]|nr:nucleoside hydrolase [Deltaproteobacteria bacterium]